MSNIPKLRFPEFKGEWEEKRIDSIFDEKKEKNHPSEEVLTIIQGTGTVPRKESGRNIIFDEKSLSNYKFVQKDDFIIHLRSFEGGLEIANSNGIVSPAYIIMHPKLSIASKFYYSYFRSYKFINHVLPVSVEGVRDGRQIKYPILKEEKIPFTSFAEQQKIADFLSNVDSIITAETKILNTLQKKKKALMQKLFTRQLRFKSDDGTDFPAWEEKKLGEISSSPKYGLNASGIDYDGEHKYLRITDIDEVTHTFSPEEITTPSEFSDDYLLEENDIVFARTGASTGKTYLYNPNDGDLYFAGFLIKFHIKDANARFVFYQTCTHEYEKWVHVMSTRSGQPGINSEEYSTLKIKLPCIEEQQKIADCLSSMDSLIQTQQKVVTTWQQRKKALLQQMFV